MADSVSDAEQSQSQRNTLGLGVTAEVSTSSTALVASDDEEGSSVMSLTRNDQGGQQRTTEGAATPMEEEEEDAELALKYGAQSLVSLIIPVTVCMAVVVANVLTITSFTENTNTYFYYTPFHEEGDISGGTRFGQALVNTLIMVGIFTVMTFIIVLLYKYRCEKILQGYLMFSSIMLLTFFSFYYFSRVVSQYNVYMDWITVSIVLWNFAAGGMAAIFWKAPLRVQQLYLLATCVLIAILFIQYLPNWTTWVLLAGMALYDLAAVLCKYGPLRLLVEMVKERDEPFMPALIYSSTMMWTVGMADSGAAGSQGEGGQYQGRLSTGEAQQLAAQRQEAQPQEEDDERGVKLGLGDFIFYSILMGRATADSSGDWNVILGCVLAILIGLSLTLLLLAIFKHALPALPISIALGLVFNFSLAGLVTPFTDALSAEQIFP